MLQGEGKRQEFRPAVENPLCFTHPLGPSMYFDPSNAFHQRRNDHLFHPLSIKLSAPTGVMQAMD
jgi:hypothetical protein